MEIKKSAFVSSAASPGNRIKSHLKQIAVVGKSNVGKSSFINLLTNDGKLARTGKLPGRTRLINYFLINEEFFLTSPLIVVLRIKSTLIIATTTPSRYME